MYHSLYLYQLHLDILKLLQYFARYGLGALIAPLVATAFVQNGLRWSLFYAVSLGFAAINVIILFLCFGVGGSVRDQKPLNEELSSSPAVEMNTVVAESNITDDSNLETEEGTTLTIDSPASNTEQDRRAAVKNKVIFTNKTVWFVSSFLLLYVVGS